MGCKSGPVAPTVFKSLKPTLQSASVKYSPTDQIPKQHPQVSANGEEVSGAARPGKMSRDQQTTFLNDLVLAVSICALTHFQCKFPFMHLFMATTQ